MLGETVMSFTGELFTKYGSDKNTNHTYGPIYDSFWPTPEERAKVEAVMEIGIASGQSVLAFRDIFPNAQIVGFDKEPCHRPEVGSLDAAICSPTCPRPPRLEIHQGDMRDFDALTRAVNGRKFDLIVEDASHLLGDNLLAFYWMFRHVKEGGFYVIEELGGPGFDPAEFLECFPQAEIVVTGPPLKGENVFVFKRKCGFTVGRNYGSFQSVIRETAPEYDEMRE